MIKCIQHFTSPSCPWLSSSFIFIAVPISSFNPCAFPEELKLKQTTIKLIEAARYQLRCSRPPQPNPPLSLQDLYSLLLVKIQFRTSSRWPSFWLFLSGCDWNTPRPDYHAGGAPLLWVRHQHDRQAAASVSFPSLKRVFLCICFQLWYQIVSCVLFFCLLSVGNHLGSMVHQRWG